MSHILALDQGTSSSKAIIFNLTGRVVGFGGRILGEGEPKYLNTPETPIFDKSRVLFGLYQHRDTIRKTRRATVVEGNFDLLALAAFGVDNVVAPLGTALTRAQILIQATAMTLQVSQQVPQTALSLLGG